MSASSLIGRSGSSAFRLSTTYSADVAHVLALLFGIVWGFFCQEAQAVQRMSSFVSFFVRSESPFLRPDPQQGQGRRAQGAVKVGRRTNLSICFALARPYLDSFEHDGTLGAVGMTIGKGARFRARINRATTLYSVGPRTRTMMQSCASAAKLRAADPFFHSA